MLSYLRNILILQSCVTTWLSFSSTSYNPCLLHCDLMLIRSSEQEIATTLDLIKNLCARSWKINPTKSLGLSISVKFSAVQYGPCRDIPSMVKNNASLGSSMWIVFSKWVKDTKVYVYVNVHQMLTSTENDNEEHRIILCVGNTQYFSSTISVITQQCHEQCNHSDRDGGYMWT